MTGFGAQATPVLHPLALLMEDRNNAPASPGLRQRVLLGGDTRPGTADHRSGLADVPLHQITLRTSASDDRSLWRLHSPSLAYTSIASHCLSFDHRLRFRAPLTAIASAFRCPTSTTRRLPRVTPV